MDYFDNTHISFVFRELFLVPGNAIITALTFWGALAFAILRVLLFGCVPPGSCSPVYISRYLFLIWGAKMPSMGPLATVRH